MSGFATSVVAFVAILDDKNVECLDQQYFVSNEEAHVELQLFAQELIKFVLSKIFARSYPRGAEPSGSFLESKVLLFDE